MRNILAALALAGVLGAGAPAQAREAPWAPVTHGNGLLIMAAHWLGSGSPFHARLPWCAAWLSMILDQTGYQSPHTWASARFLSYGHRLSGPRRGAIAVIAWHGRRPQHVALVEGIDRAGIHIISGNFSHRVGRGIVRASQVLAYADPVASAAAAVPWPIRRRHPKHHRRR